MAWRRAHGRAAELGRTAVIETLPADELPEGLPAPNTPAQPARDRRGRYLAGAPETRAAAASGGKARRSRTELAHSLGITSEDPDWSKLLRQANAFRRAQVRLLARNVGGGTCGPAPAALIAQAALALAGSRLCYQRGDLVRGARLGAEVRACLLGAHELAAKEALTRPPKPSDYPWLRDGRHS